MTGEETKDISEFWGGGKQFEGDKIKIKELVDKDIILLDGAILPSKYQPGKDCAFVKIELDGIKRVFFASSATIIGSIKFLKEKKAIPGRVKCRIIQEKATTGRMQYKFDTALPKENVEKPQDVHSSNLDEPRKKGRKTKTE